MTGVVGDFAKLRQLEQSIRQLPMVVAQKVAARAASTITALARGTFAASENAYGDAWKESAEGERVTLIRDGRLRQGIEYVAIGTRLRARLGVPYAKYQVGRRPVFPRNGAALPTAYVETLRRDTNEVINAELGAG